MTTRGFPNMFIMPAPGQQAVVTHNFTHLMVVGAEHIAATIALLEARGVKVFEVTRGGRAGLDRHHPEHGRDNSAFMAACTPSRLNFEGDPSMLNPRSGAYGGGYGDFFGCQDLLAEWRGPATSTGSRSRPQECEQSSVTVVTGGAVGIGAAIAEELGRQGVFVVTVDPGVAVDGSPGEGGAEATTAQRIVDAGGQARASNTSVTDEDAVRALFAGAGRRVRGARRGRQRRRHQPSDRLRPRRRGRLARGARRAPQRLPQRAPRRVAAHGRGRTRTDPRRHLGLGVAGRRRRRVQLREARGRRAHLAASGRTTPPGVTVNALSPIAATRMVLGAAPARRARRRVTRRPAACRSGSRRCRRPSTSARSARTWRARTSRRGRGADHVLQRGGGRVGRPAAPPRSRAHHRRRLAARGARVRRATCFRAGRSRTGEQRRWQPPPRRRVRRAAPRTPVPRRRSARGDRHRRRRRAPPSREALLARGVDGVTIDGPRRRRSPPRRSSSRRSRTRVGPVDAVVVALAGGRGGRGRPTPTAGSGSSTSTPVSTEPSAPTPPGCGPSPTTRSASSVRSGS